MNELLNADGHPHWAINLKAHMATFFPTESSEFATFLVNPHWAINDPWGLGRDAAHKYDINYEKRAKKQYARKKFDFFLPTEL